MPDECRIETLVDQEWVLRVPGQVEQSRGLGQRISASLKETRCLYRHFDWFHKGISGHDFGSLHAEWDGSGPH